MKKLLHLLLLGVVMPVQVLAQSAAKPAVATAGPDQTRPVQVVEASCGQCQLGLPGKSCDLAVRLNGQAYFVDGTHIDSHGDAHAKDGFCQKIRQAQVQGAVVNERFVATYFRLLPEVAKPQ
ncbi:DUF6370 family protein [Hymenobacter psychrophilus]|uniref:Glutaminyl-tRNA synthetase n=1 Tax=Hymenobacter psychrophilus TaxID=651662 RepID=A0A1H3J317_9BACT|nr:DUF6370 family protein [Hymenobacter psychrophilus]SDY33995.1 hypothetical protein SAMN04488069_107255 [Hymenobacter psychrophilus]